MPLPTLAKKTHTDNGTALLIALIMLCAVSFLIIYFKIDLESTLNAQAIATVSQQVARVEARLRTVEQKTSDTSSAAPQANFMVEEYFNPWCGLSFGEGIKQTEWSATDLAKNGQTCHVLLNKNSSLSYVELTMEPLTKSVASTIKATPYKNLVYKPAGVCDVYSDPKKDDCGAAFYFTTSRNVYKIYSGFTAPLSPFKDLDSPEGKQFFSQLNESDL